MKIDSLNVRALNDDILKNKAHSLGLAAANLLMNSDAGEFVRKQLPQMNEVAHKDGIGLGGNNLSALVADSMHGYMRPIAVAVVLGKDAVARRHFIPGFDEKIGKNEPGSIFAENMTPGRESVESPPAFRLSSNKIFLVEKNSRGIIRT